MKMSRQLRLRLLISVLTAALVTVISCVVAWQGVGTMSNFRPRESATMDALADIERMIEVYRRDANSLPESLAELNSVNEAYHQFKVDADSMPLDAWGRPFVYAIDGNNFTVMSYARDGKPGGVGLDGDLSTDTVWPRKFVLPFGQFIFHPPARGVVVTCLVTGFVVFFLCALTVDPSGLRLGGIVAVAVSLIVTTFGAVIAALFIIALHIPNHH